MKVSNEFKRMATFKDFVGELTAIYKRTEQPSTKIVRSRDAAKFARPYFQDIMDDHEEFKVIHLNHRNCVVNVHHVSTGGDTGTMVPIRDVMQKALLIKTHNLIAVHNHPSGNLKPSKADIAITKKLKKASSLVDIKFLDHIILSSEGYYSLSDHGDI